MSLFLLHKAFLRPLFTNDSRDGFLFLSATNITKLERPHRAGNRAITGCISSSPIPLLLSEAPLRVTLTPFALSSYEWALCLLNCFLTSGLARLGVKPRLCRSFRIAFASTYPLMVSPTSPRGISLLALAHLGTCIPSSWRALFSLHASTLIPLSLARCGSRSP